MAFHRAFLILCTAALILVTEQSTCKNLIKCPCGNTGQSFTACLESATTSDPCSKWASCKSCQDELNICLECPDGLEGSFCNEVADVKIISRQKRQYRSHPTYVRRQPQSSPLQENPEHHAHYPSYRQWNYNKKERKWRVDKTYAGTCSDVQSPKLGSLRCVSVSRVRTCTGKCLPGYAFENSDATEMELRCHNGVWSPSSQFPQCKSQGHCNLEMQGHGSFNCTVGMDGTYCDVFCSQRYIGRYHCLPESEWNPQLPWCVRPKAVQTSQVVRQRCRCVNGGSCDRNGDCICPVGRTGQFCESVIPVKSACNDPGFIDNGVRRYMNGTASTARPRFNDGESVVFTCKTEEYALKGSPLLICNDGVWSGDLPKCIKPVVNPEVTCPDPGPVSNADRLNSDDSPYVGFQQYKVHQSVIYTCHSGFTIQRRNVITCLASGTWSHQRPYCRRVNTPPSFKPTPTASPERLTFCSDPGEDPSGSRIFVTAPSSRGFPQGTRLEYLCNHNFELKGEKYLFCLVSGQWSALVPKCEERESVAAFCADPGVDPNGSRETTMVPIRRGFPQGSHLVYKCKQNFDLKGERNIFCLISGQWSSPIPECEDQSRSGGPSDNTKYCLNPGNIDDGNVLYYPTIDSRRGTSDNLNDYEYPKGSMLRYTCNTGYELQGSEFIVCEATGKWSTLKPTCRRGPDDNTEYCLNPGNIDDGDVSYYPTIDSRKGTSDNANDFEYPKGSMLRYTCNAGYKLQGSESIVCETTGKWSALKPTCRRGPDDNIEYCLNPGNIENGRVMYYLNIDSRKGTSDNLDDFEYPQGSMLRYTCNTGYELRGSGSIECEATGKWSALKPTCRRETGDKSEYCLNPGYLNYGRIMYYPTINSRKGSTDNLDDPEYPQGSMLRYICNTGYELQGSGSLVCEATGEWSSLKPTCKKGTRVELVYCKNPGAFSHGRRVHYPNLTSRTASPQSILNDPEYPQGSRFVYSCNTGYALEGEASLICEESGIWSEDPPTCRRVSAATTLKYCNNPGPISNGQVQHIPTLDQRRRPLSSQEDSEYPQGTRLRYSCINGYVLQGEPSLTCKSTGLWSSAPPKCFSGPSDLKMYCDYPGPIENGEMKQYPPLTATRTGSRPIDENIQYEEGTRLEYTCEKGYTLNGSYVLSCLRTGRWSSDVPICSTECGRSLIRTFVRITNGMKTKVGQWPWVVAIAVRVNDVSQVICGGALLNTRTVVTAAHCLEGASTFTLYFGKLHREDALDDKEVLVSQSTRIIMHPNFNRTSYDSDIALIKFSPQIVYSQRVKPICLPSKQSTAMNIMTGKVGYVIGWGLTERSLPSNELLLAELPVLSNNQCMKEYRDQNLAVTVTDNMFCAGHELGNQSACSGDSGSPLCFFDSKKEKFTLEGVVSFGVLSQCGMPRRYIVFTKVFQFVPWINENLT